MKSNDENVKTFRRMFFGLQDCKSVFEEMEKIWTCHICGAKRSDKDISVRSNDIGIDHNLPLGIIFENVRYCNDNFDCVDKSKTFRLTGEKK